MPPRPRKQKLSARIREIVCGESSRFPRFQPDILQTPTAVRVLLPTHYISAQGGGSSQMQQRESRAAIAAKRFRLRTHCRPDRRRTSADGNPRLVASSLSATRASSEGSDMRTSRMSATLEFVGRLGSSRTSPASRAFNAILAAMTRASGSDASDARVHRRPAAHFAPDLAGALDINGGGKEERITRQPVGQECAGGFAPALQQDIVDGRPINAERQSLAQFPLFGGLDVAAEDQSHPLRGSRTLDPPCLPRTA